MKKMIKINLAPAEELENPLWFVPDVAAICLVAMLSYFIVDLNLEKIREEIDEANIQSEELVSQNIRIKAQAKRFDELDTVRLDLLRKKEAVEKITSSKLDRYLPIIILENIQNLKPDGIWLHSISFMNSNSENKAENQMLEPVNTKGPKSQLAGNVNTANFHQDDNYNVVKIDGSGFDNILISEFITNLKSTINQEFDKTDLRSLVYFDDVTIHNSKTDSRELNIEQALDDKVVIAKYNIDINKFSISFRFKEKQGSEKEMDLK